MDTYPEDNIPGPENKKVPQVNACGIYPRIGDVIEGTGGARKMRIQMENRGKSGGARVIYVDVFEKEKLYLLLAYPKSVQDDLTPEQRKQVRKLVEAIKKE